MIDFLITPSGDLAFTEIEKENQTLEISFYKTKTQALKISFEMDTYLTNTPKKDSLVVYFDLLSIKNNKRAMLVEDDAYKMQQIFMRIKTSLGELPERPEVGSKIETVMHQNIHDKAVQSKVERIVGDAIKDIVYNHSVKAIPTVIKDNDYKQVMNVMIYEDDDLLLTYEMEG